MSQNTDTWVVVADPGQTRIFRTDPEMTFFEPVTTHANDQHGGVGGGGHGDHRDPRDRGEHAAAKALATELNDAHNQHRYRDLVLVAAPSFLGMIRGELPTGAARSVGATVHHDYTGLQQAEIRALVKKHLLEKPLPR